MEITYPILIGWATFRPLLLGYFSTVVNITFKSDHRLDDLITVSGLSRSTFFEHQRRLNEPNKYAHLKKL
ncbi:hypothetical protein, partial [Corynebacterium belfantii]